MGQAHRCCYRLILSCDGRPLAVNSIPKSQRDLRGHDSPKALRARRNISSEALRVNVRSMIRPGSIPCDTSQATRDARVWSCLCRPRQW
jgi:hypothetical protein